MAEYFELDELPGKTMFRCGRHHCTMQVTACAEMWRQANEQRMPPERLDPCRNCQLGAKHAGVGEISLSPLRGAHICGRCNAGATRLIRGHLCPSCYNRELEYLKGVNAKGAAPVRHPALHRIELTIRTDGRVKRFRRGAVVGTHELVVAALRDEPKQVALSFLSNGRARIVGHRQGELF